MTARRSRSTPLFDQAAFGRGHETVVDLAVRTTLEVCADRIVFGPADDGWRDGTAFSHLLESIKRRLGMPGKRLTASLFKVLLYTEGSFFAEHIDSEKQIGMVGTLTITMPSSYLGSELIVNDVVPPRGARRESSAATSRIAGRFGGQGSHNMTYAAFYADCPHEVTRLVSGARLVFTYNLLVDVAVEPSSVDTATAADVAGAAGAAAAASATSNVAPASARDVAERRARAMEEVCDAVRAFDSRVPHVKGQRSGMRGCVTTLAHAYTTHGLRLQHWKGVDGKLLARVRAYNELVDELVTAADTGAGRAADDDKDGEKLCAYVGEVAIWHENSSDRYDIWQKIKYELQPILAPGTRELVDARVDPAFLGGYAWLASVCVSDVENMLSKCNLALIANAEEVSCPDPKADGDVWSAAVDYEAVARMKWFSHNNEYPAGNEAPGAGHELYVPVLVLVPLRLLRALEKTRAPTTMSTGAAPGRSAIEHSAITLDRALTHAMAARVDGTRAAVPEAHATDPLDETRVRALLGAWNADEIVRAIAWLVDHRAREQPLAYLASLVALVCESQRRGAAAAEANPAAVEEIRLALLNNPQLPAGAVALASRLDRCA